MTKRLRVAILLGFFGWASFAAGDDTPLSLASYKSQIEQYSAQIQKVVDRPEYAVEFDRNTPSKLEVQIQPGVISVPLEFLHQGLETFLKSPPTAKPAVISQLGERIKQMRAEADGFQQGRNPDPAIRERLDRILAAREFRRMHGPTELELLQERIQAWLREKLGKLFPSAPDLDQLGEILVWIVIGIVSSILAVWLYRRSRERLLDRPREIVPFIPSARSWRSWMTEARERATLGQWREAIRLGFWAAVSRLESDGVWRPDKARTPREYLQAIPALS